jgi:hypothetical protein
MDIKISRSGLDKGKRFFLFAENQLLSAAQYFGKRLFASH